MFVGVCVGSLSHWVQSAVNCYGRKSKSRQPTRPTKKVIPSQPKINENIVLFLEVEKLGK